LKGVQWNENRWNLIFLNSLSLPQLQELDVFLIDWLFKVLRLAQEFFTYMKVTIAGERLQNLGICSALRVFEQKRNFIVPHLLWHGASVFPVSSEGPPHSVASYDTQRVWRIFLTGRDVFLWSEYFLKNRRLIQPNWKTLAPAVKIEL
jgi:hypothetical protein